MLTPENLLPEDVIRKWKRDQDRMYFTFRPRIDQPERHDQQAAFYNSDATGVNFLLGGNGAGTTTTALAKSVKLVLRDQPPPRPATPFWIIAEGYNMAMDVCWNEKLCGRGLLPEEEVQWDKIDWYRSSQNWPFRVPLKPWPGHDPRNYWVLEFKSYSQGRARMQASSIGGFCFVEQCPWELITEVNRGCRDYNFPGSKMAEFTPIDPFLSQPLEKMMREGTLPETWKVFRCNTQCAMEQGHVSKEWFDEFFGMLPEEERAVRMIGAFASFDGLIYPSFNAAVHTQDGVGDLLVDGVHHFRAIDWGSGPDNAMVCLWGALDSAGTWYIYDEYYSTDQKATYLDHAAEIKDRHKWDSKNPFHRDTYADPAAPGLMRLFTQKAGIVTTPAKNAVLEGINCVKEHLMISHGEPRIVIDKKCENLIREFQTYRWLTNRSNDQFTSDKACRPLKKDDHTMDALRYMLYSSQQSVRNGLSADRIVPKNMKRFVGTGLTRGEKEQGWSDAAHLLD
jgi:hypothetical protein